MKRKYIIPKMETFTFDVDDIITTSGEDDLPIVPLDANGIDTVEQ